jgi:hypothetical protein
MARWRKNLSDSTDFTSRNCGVAAKPAVKFAECICDVCRWRTALDGPHPLCFTGDSQPTRPRRAWHRPCIWADRVWISDGLVRRGMGVRCHALRGELGASPWMTSVGLRQGRRHNGNIR